MYSFRRTLQYCQCFIIGRPTDLKYVELESITNVECKKYHKDLIDTQLCCQGKEGKSACSVRHVYTERSIINCFYPSLAIAMVTVVRLISKIHYVIE